ncbi:unnamed protein product [Bemisia tabaci]|uniref:Serine carboxypeptidase n=1 Tax=Bemisia tabaci TaxID=7038 RepID=A0A9P0AHZ0_BEMTA|nr:unnamed protein product [Bemisia tabaci]
MWKFCIINQIIVSGILQDVTSFASNQPGHGIGATPVGEEAALFLTPYIEKGKIKEALKLATVRPAFKNIESFSGFLTINKTTDSNLFFWLFKSQRGNWQERPLVVWLSGGPGTSSLVGLLFEQGPYKLTESNTLKRRRITLNRDYNMLFIDNPIGAGFSYTSIDSGYARTDRTPFSACTRASHNYTNCSRPCDGPNSSSTATRTPGSPLSASAARSTR